MISRTPEYKSGIGIELRLKSWLEQQEWVSAIALVRHGNTFAPLLETWAGKVRLPDLQVHLTSGDYIWLEAKSKSQCAKFEAAGIRTTGIDSDCFADYKAVEARTMHPVWVVFIHEREDQVRLARPDHRWFKGAGSGSGMMYVDWDSLPLLCSRSTLMGILPSTAGLGKPLFVPSPIQTELF